MEWPPQNTFAVTCVRLLSRVLALRRDRFRTSDLSKGTDIGGRTLFYAASQNHFGLPVCLRLCCIVVRALNYYEPPFSPSVAIPIWIVVYALNVAS